MPTPRPRVYLAGPMVFDPFPTALFDRMVEGLVVVDAAG